MLRLTARRTDSRDEALLYDCMTGDATLFQRADMVEACWRAVQPVLDDWAQRAPADFPSYASGSAGPASSDTLLAMGGRSWRPLHSNNESVGRKASRAKADTAAQPATAPAKKRVVAKKRTATKKAASKKVAAKKVIAATVAKKSPARKTATKKTAARKRTATTRTRGK